MREQQRLDYLQAMGIVQWMPRQPLPGVPAPRWLPEDAHAAPVRPVLMSEGGGHIAHPMAAQLLHEASALPVAKAPVSVQNVPVETPATAVSESAAVAPAVTTDLTPPRFELHFLRVSANGVWVCDDAAQAERLAAFAYRVMSALQAPVGLLHTPLCFRWPFIESAQDDQSLPVALQALSAQWQFLRDNGVRYAVAFGQDSDHWLQQVQAPLLFRAASLSEVMQNAQHKRQLWQALLTQSEL
ncbi:MAG: hypothetical protein LRY66_14230 [Saccharospirillaceae bacterium]|nr:hypothetical protein [Saccharospirillaceae bacterium]MCD8532465.1 hypothetical protein [Saccharospirillaceae bacterium]